MAGSAAIEVERLLVARGGKTVLHEVSLAVATGAVTGLLGPSGCGKTTLMRSIMGVQIVAGGEVKVLGRPAGSPELRPRVGYVTQAPSVYADLTVKENLRYFGRVLGVGEARIAEVIDMVQLSELADRVTHDTSGGQRARVSLATALLGEPDVLVLDEPTVGLDPILRRDLWQTFADLAEQGVALLVSSHVMDEAQHCDRLVLMRDGRVLVEESLAKLLRQTGAADAGEAFLKLVEAGE